MDVILKKVLHGVLRKNTLRIKHSSVDSSKNIILSGLVRHKSAVDPEGRILEVILLSYKKLFSKLCYQSLKRKKSYLYRVLDSSKGVQLRWDIWREKEISVEN